MEEQKQETCGFHYNDEKCKCTEIVGIARCTPLCKVHYKTVIKDNIRRFNKGVEIPDTMEFTKELSRSETWSIFGGNLDNEKEVEKNGN